MRKMLRKGYPFKVREQDPQTTYLTDKDKRYIILHDKKNVGEVKALRYFPEMEALLYNLTLSDQIGEKEKKEIDRILRKINYSKQGKQ
jgi:hypothetical protein